MIKEQTYSYFRETTDSEGDAEFIVHVYRSSEYQVMAQIDWKGHEDADIEWFNAVIDQYYD
jgi:hypothetical protein